jgi:hypothetical protein
LEEIRRNSNNAITFEEQNLTDQQRNTALANVSNQEAGYDTSEEPPVFTGKMGYVVLQPQDYTNLEKTSFAAQIANKPNTIFEIRDVFDLGGTQETPVNITIPVNCTLKNNGGLLKNGTIQLNNTSIQSDTPIFGDNIVVEGKAIQEALPEWFTGSDADKIEKAIKYFHSVKLAARDYLIDRQIEVTNSFELTGCGFADFFGEGHDRSTIERDLSSSRLVATSVFNSTATENYTPAIIKIGRGTEAYQRFYSVSVQGVSFVGKDHIGYGIEICTPNGPSRPVSIINCNFKYFNHAVDINNDGIDGTSAAPTSTNVGVFNFERNNATNNDYAIYVSGNHALMMANIVGNNLEQNVYGAIYAMDSHTRPNGVATVPLFNGLTIKDNLLEGQPYPISIRLKSYCTVYIIDNYFESSSQQTVRINCADLVGANAVISGNAATGGGLIWVIKKCNIIITDDATKGNVFDLESCKCFGIMPDKLLNVVSTCFEKNPATKEIRTVTSFYTPLKTHKVGDYYYREFTNTTMDTISMGSSAATLAAGKYRMVCRIISNKADNILGLRFNEIDYYSSLIRQNGESYFVNDMNLESGGSSLLSLRVKCASGDSHLYLSDVTVAKLGETTLYDVPFISDDAYRTTSALKATFVGESAYFNNQISVWNGDRWMRNGFTYANRKGDSTSRPETLYDSLDIGYDYYDTSLGKVIFANNFVKGSRVVNQSVGGHESVCIGNSLLTKVEYSFQISVTIKVKIAFRKTNDNNYTSDDEIVIAETTITKDVPTKFSAPNQSEYPYLYLYSDRPAGNALTFQIHRWNTVWKDSQGYTAALSKGDTASRPTNLTTDDFGFEYADSDLGKKIMWNGTDWVNLDGTALT